MQGGGLVSWSLPVRSSTHVMSFPCLTCPVFTPRSLSSSWLRVGMCEPSLAERTFLLCPKSV